MSYILDALRRADAQRRQGQTPILQQIAAGPAPSSRHASATRLHAALRVLAAAALLTATGLALGWWWGRRTGDAPAAPIPPSSPITTLAPIAPVASTVPAAASAPAVQPQVHAATPERAATKARAPASRRARREGKAASSASAASAASAASTAAATAVAQAASAPASAASEGRPQAAAALPEPLRSRVARLRFGGAVQSQDRRQSFVLMDGQIVREGQTLAPGIVLEHIRARSLRLRVDGRAVELAL